MSSKAKSRDLISVVKATLSEHGMIRTGDTVLVGVSGGPDSMALLRVLHLLGESMGFSLVAAHVDHKLRPGSHNDALFVKNEVEKLGIPVHMTEADVHARALVRRRGVEEAGRRVRYELFEKVRSFAGAQRIATAHHADDSIETFFFRMLTGAGPQGLSGIAPVRGRLIRPLIRCHRAEIVAFLEDRSIPYRIDPTNLNADTDRNFLRNDVLPLIAHRFPRFKKPLLRTMQLVHQDEQLLHDLASRLTSTEETATQGETVLAATPLRRAPRPLAARAIMEALYDLSGADLRLTKSHLDSVLAIIHGDNPSASASLPGGSVVVREYDKIKLYRRQRPAPVWTPIIVSREGGVEVPGTGMRLDFRLADRSAADMATSSDPSHCTFDADLASFPLVLRPVREGDRFKPWGFRGTRKLKKVLIDHKVPLDLRRRLPLLVKDDEILWIPGIRRSSLAAVGPSTQRVLTAHIAESR